ncbi:MAG: hypothetical protein ABSA23_10545 [Anaerolineales bacterium]
MKEEENNAERARGVGRNNEEQWGEEQQEENTEWRKGNRDQVFRRSVGEKQQLTAVF